MGHLDLEHFGLGGVFAPLGREAQFSVGGMFSLSHFKS